MGDNLPVESVEEDLGLSPSYIGKRGEHIRGNPKYAKNQTNIWVWEYPSSTDVPFEEQIRNLLSIVELHAVALKNLLSLPGITGELFLGFSSMNGQGSAEFSPDLLRRLGDLELTLLLDLYPPSADEING